MKMDDPNYLVDLLVHESMYAHSSYGFPIIGSSKSIKKITQNDLLQFKKQFYIPSRTAFIVTGNFKKDKIYNKIKKEFSKNKCSFKPQNDDKLICTIIQNNPHIHLHTVQKLNHTWIKFVFRTVSMFDADAYYLDILADILTSGLSSVLYESLRHKSGYTYSVEAICNLYAHEGSFEISISTMDENVFNALELILNELNTLIRKGISHEQLTKIKKSYETKEKISFNDPVAYFNKYGPRAIFNGINKSKIKIDPIREVNDSIKNITIHNINQVIAKVIHISKTNLFIYGNVIDVKKNINKIMTMMTRKLS